MAQEGGQLAGAFLKEPCRYWVGGTLFIGIARTAATTSSTETGWKPENTQSVDVNTGDAALHVDTRHVRDFLGKKTVEVSGIDAL